VNKFKIQLALKNCRIKRIPEERLREKDPDLVSFSTSTRRKTWHGPSSCWPQAYKGRPRMDIAQA